MCEHTTGALSVEGRTAQIQVLGAGQGRICCQRVGAVQRLEAVCDVLP